jgi:hypothetical protein
MKHLKLLTVLLSAGLWISCDKDDDDDHYPPHHEVKKTVVKSAGDLTAALTEFRALLGDPLNPPAGQTTGRREITWDGIPPNLTNNDLFPLDFFSNFDPNGPAGRKRGLLYVDNGAKFRADSTAYSEIEATYALNFKAFSQKRLITAINKNVSEVVFKVPNTNTDAFIRGFGIVFSDVDNEDYTTVEFYNGNKSLGTFKAPARTDANGHSFLGVFFPEEKVTRVKITAGNGVLNGQKDITDGGQKDLVVFDDFLYNEPVAN